MKIAMPELLAPAGNMERLTTAIDYGADAVYLGAQSMSLRNYADNFTPEQLRAGCEYAHGRNAKVYVACNAFCQANMAFTSQNYGAADNHPDCRRRCAYSQ